MDVTHTVFSLGVPIATTAIAPTGITGQLDSRLRWMESSFLFLDLERVSLARA